MGAFFIWLLGIAGAKGIDKFLAFIKPAPVYVSIHKVFNQWMDELPKHANLISAEALFPTSQVFNNADKPCLLLVRQKITNQQSPTVNEWHSALLEQWLCVKSEIECPQDFFLLGKQEASLYLLKLAQCLEMACRLQDVYFQTFVIESLTQLLEQKTYGRAQNANGILIEAIDGTIWLGDQKYEANGLFTVESCFYVSVGNQPILLLGLNGQYLSRGCRSLNSGKGRLYLETEKGDKSVPISEQGDVLTTLNLSSNNRYKFSYFQVFRPPLMSQTPLDCDKGDLLLGLKWRPDDVLDSKTYNVCMSYETNKSNRDMQLVDAPRPPPRFDDEEIEYFYQQRELTEFEYKEVLKLPQSIRYLLAISQNQSGIATSYTSEVRTALKRLIKVQVVETNASLK